MDSNDPAVREMVLALLTELGEELCDLGSMQEQRLESALRKAGDRHVVFGAFTDDELLGLVTASECCAIYANGTYGIINEMYVAPERRSSAVGGALLEAVKALASERGWSRIDVTAPESERWERTRRFYEKNGFTFAGPKLKLLLR